MNKGIYRRSLLALAMLAAVPAHAADPYAVPPFPTDYTALNCEIYEQGRESVRQQLDARREANQNKADALTPKMQAEMQAAMASGNYAAIQQYSEMGQGQLSLGETDADCIALGSSNSSSGTSQAIAPPYQAASASFKAKISTAVPGDTSAFQAASPAYLGELNQAVAKTRATALRCNAGYSKRYTAHVSKLKGSMRELIASQADPEVSKLENAEHLWQDAYTICGRVQPELSMAATGGSRSYSGRPRAPGVAGMVDSAKDSAVGKAVDKAFGSLFGR
ncbi:hypothetical protein C3942_04000 [Solimonas fluminis]|uniref:DUF1311 domain-containing protein n=1 Tax=Solimonas fluminis TaxID=2086571 RepID=A0A2S5TIR6_9GAMM|nr:hypothetical protein [Solimonas fluminis]PPE74847.1 hypothetical protein C3942_04000 [Solimonas fluminis]